MRDIILSEKKLHPAAQPGDYIKLLFQSEYGPGHLIQDRGYSSRRLYEEWQKVKHLPVEAPQPIGGGYIRLCIKGLEESRLEKVNAAFVASANIKSGSDTAFLAKLETLKAMAAEGLLAFDSEAAEKAVEEYLAGGIRPVSHTEEYHRHYTPAYRVVREDFYR